MFIILPAPNAGVDFAPTNEEYLNIVKRTVGDDSISVDILNVSKWSINEVVAEYYSEGNM